MPANALDSYKLALMSAGPITQHQYTCMQILSDHASLIDWISDLRSQGCTELQSLVKCLDLPSYHACLDPRIFEVASVHYLSEQESSSAA